MKKARDPKFDRRRLLSVAAVVVGGAAVSTVGACGTDRFDFKPRREGIRGAGGG